MKILLPVDGSEYSTLAAEFIASRTSLLGRKPEIEILNAQFLNGSVVTGALLSEVWGEKSLEELYRVRAEKAFAAVRTPLQKKAIPFREMIVRKAPAEAVLEETAAWKPDLIVMGTQGKTNAEKLFLGSVSTAVLAGTSVPVLLVRDTPAPKKDDLKVGIAVDGSPYGEIAVRYLERYRELLGANPEIHVLNVVEDAINTMIAASSDCDMAIVTEEEARKL
ncbi:MAG: universal stress protein, partial [Sutterellaceae bacterium]|nr:universal stress protein [Sutterellaceae bacterium]